MFLLLGHLDDIVCFVAIHTFIFIVCKRQSKCNETIH